MSAAKANVSGRKAGNSPLRPPEDGNHINHTEDSFNGMANPKKERFGSGNTVDEISRAFDELDSRQDREVYTRPSRDYKPRKGGKSRKALEKGRINMMKTFANAPFQYQEAFLSLRTNIRFLSENKEYRKIVITSAIPSEGKSSISVNLSLALSAANNKVILIDADLRKPTIHNYLQLQNGTSMGLTNLLYEKETLTKEAIRQNVDGKGLSVIPCGVIPPNPTEILGSRRMGHMLQVLGDLYDYVILDTPPVSVVTDAAVLSRHSDGVILVVKQKYATFEQARQAKKNLNAVNANILGAVINDFDYKHMDKTSGSYYYYYSGR